MKTLQKKW